MDQDLDMSLTIRENFLQATLFLGETSVHESCKIKNVAIADFVFSNSKNLACLDSR